MGDISYIPGRILHLWHGARTNRLYMRWQDELSKFKFNPRLDIKIGPNGTWEWATNKPELHEWVEQYFDKRKEDTIVGKKPRQPVRRAVGQVVF